MLKPITTPAIATTAIRTFHPCCLIMRPASSPNLIASHPSIKKRIARPIKIAVMNLQVFSLKTPAHSTKGLNGNGGGSTAGTITAIRS
jgi:hypothetical protein